MAKIILKISKKYAFLILFFAILIVFSWKIIIKNYTIGPFDFLVGFYHPYKTIQWGSSVLDSATLHYKNYMLSDVVVTVLPVKLLAVSLLKQGILPLWNPYSMNGIPLLANVQSSVLYPATILYFIFDIIVAYNIYILSQLALGFMFMYVYLQSLNRSRIASFIGSISFTLSTYSIVWLCWGTITHAFIWMPFILWSTDMYKKKRYFKYLILSSLGITLSVFAGHTQTTVMVVIAYVIINMIKIYFEKNIYFIKPLIIILLLSLLFSSAQLVPSFEMYTQSARELVAGDNFYKGQTLRLTSYLQAFAPDFFGHPTTRNWWGIMNYNESAIYFGTVPLLMVAYTLAKRKLIDFTHIAPFLSVAFIGFILSFQNPLSYLLFKLKIPIVSTSTFSRFSSLFIFAFATISAFGFDDIFSDIKKNRHKKIIYFSLSVAAFIILLWFFVLFELIPKTFIENSGIIKRNLILPTMLSFLFILLLNIRFITSKIKLDFPLIHKHIYKSAQFLILVIIALELIRNAWKFTPFSPKEFFFPNHQLINKLQNISKGHYYFGYVPANTNTIYQIGTIEGSDPLYPLRSAEIADLTDDKKVNLTTRSSLNIPEGRYKQKILDIFAQKYFTDERDNFRNSWVNSFDRTHEQYDSQFKLIWKDDIYMIYDNKKASPRLSVRYDPYYSSSKDQTFKYMISSKFDPKESIILDTKTSYDISKKGKYLINILLETPTLQRYKIDTDTAGIFTVIDTWYPGWQAKVDGEETNIMRVNYAFKGIPINKGRHIVELVYRPINIYIAGAISSISIFFALIYLFLVNEKSRI